VGFLSRVGGQSERYSVANGLMKETQVEGEISVLGSNCRVHERIGDVEDCWPFMMEINGKGVPVAVEGLLDLTFPYQLFKESGSLSLC